MQTAQGSGQANSVKLPVKQAIATIFKALSALGFSKQEAFDTTRGLCFGEIRGGKHYHGLDRVQWIVDHYQKSFISGREVTGVYRRESPNLIILDGHGGVGYSQIYEAVVCAETFLQKRDLIAVALRDAYPTNCLGDYASILARGGYCCYVGSLSPQKVALPGGKKAKLPTCGQAA